MLGAGQNVLAYGSMAVFRFGTGEPFGKQTLAGQCTGHNRDAAARQPLPEPFVVAEQEHLVFLDRASQYSSELMALERRGADGCIEEVPGVEGAVAQKFEHVSVQLVGPGGGHDVDRALRPASHTRRHRCSRRD